MPSSPEFSPHLEQLTNPTHSNMEGLGSRIQRHVKEFANGEIDLQAIFKGGHQVYDRLTLMREADGSLDLKERQTDYAGVNGLDFSLYSFIVPVGPSRPAYSPEFTTYRDVQIRILDLPVDSHMEVYLTPKGEKYIHTNSNAILSKIPGTIASITGPTYLKGDDLPNNGFYSRETGDTRPFRETNPPGERRGAFGLTNEGKLVLMKDSQKWAVVNQDFEGYRYLVGTSHFILGSDTDQNYPDFNQADKNCLSYIIESVQTDGQIRYSFVRNERMLSRNRLRKVMQFHSCISGRRMNTALELEFGNASCVVRTNQDKSELGTGFNTRRDHYLFVRNPANLPLP